MGTIQICTIRTSVSQNSQILTALLQSFFIRAIGHLRVLSNIINLQNILSNTGNNQGISWNVSSVKNLLLRHVYESIARSCI